MTGAGEAPAFVSVDRLGIELDDGAPVVQEVSFEVRPGETLGLVGESGSGKSTVALALLGYLRPGMRWAEGSVRIGEAVVGADRPEGAGRLRGRQAAHVPQDPATSLNPSMRVGGAVGEVLRRHRPDLPRSEAVLEALAKVSLPASDEFAQRFPHQLSGGQQQRVLIAAAMACEPGLIVLDEPTTGLDVVTQERVLGEVRRLRHEHGAAMVYVSHDLAVVSEVADTIAVMYAGWIVEEGPARDVLSSPRHPYTRGLVTSVPDHRRPRALQGIPGVSVGVGERPPGCPFEPRCPQREARCATEVPPVVTAAGRSVRCFLAERTPTLRAVDGRPPRVAEASEAVLVVEHLVGHHRGRDGRRVVVDDVSFRLARGACVAIAGESGSGKTTLARMIVGLHAPSTGRILLGDEPLAPSARQRSRAQRRSCQLVFQNPSEALNPRRRVRDELARPMRLLRGLGSREAAAEVLDLLELVQLPRPVAAKYPGELSGGERQRVAIARALAARPSVLVCDEVTSALDVSVQATIVSLLEELRATISMVFITHNLGVIASIADRVLVLDRGRVCEEGPVGEVFERPVSPATEQLLRAAPVLAGS